jgi:serine/threonine protein kinase
MPNRKRHQKASEILLGAVDLPRAERDAFITAACGRDAALEKEVRSLLAHDVPDSELTTEPGPLPEPRDMTGSTVGRYRIVSELGRGGMGIVWKAEDPVLGRLVAIKFLPPSQARQETARRRFLREARAASSLSHPGIATVYDVGEVDGEPYIAMQFVEGRTVRERLKQQPYAPSEAVRVALQAARVLDYAHARGVIHRDVSASNIMVTNDGSVVMLDFGVALRSADSSRLSRSGELVGTIGYMAPEIIMGEDATAQSDVFSLGVVLYQMVTGYVPFRSDKPSDFIRATRELDPEPPSRLVRGVTKELDRVIETALARDLTHRYASAHRFADDLEAIIRDGSLPRYPRGAARPPRPRNPRRKLARVIDLVARLGHGKDSRSAGSAAGHDGAAST